MPKKKSAIKKRVARKATAKKKKKVTGGAKSTRRAKIKVKRPARKRRAASRPRAAAKTVKKVVRKPASRRSSVSTKAGKKGADSLGRPRVPADAVLDLVFRNDYQAREVFGFLGVHTVRELEEHDPQDVIEKLTSPMVQTVSRIRKALAMNNRFMKGDRKFALEFQKRLKKTS